MAMKVQTESGVTTALVVDDEPAIRRVVTSALEDLGCVETYSAPDAEIALEILASRKPDIVITDVKLPGVDGIELTERVKEGAGLSTSSATPVILMSAFGEPPNHRGDHFLAKPFNIADLAAAVAPYLG